MNTLLSTEFRPFRRKIYDLLKVAPLIAWYLFSLRQVLTAAAEQARLVELFVETDVSVLPALLLLSLASKITTAFFLALLVVMFLIRQVALSYPIPISARFVS